MDIDKLEVKKELKIIFMGTPEFSVPVLQGLIDNYYVRAIITQPDRPVGRDQLLTPPPVKIEGLKHNILVIQPEKVASIEDEIRNLEPDIIITCAYGQIIPRAILEIPSIASINVHASLLPKLRGGAPIHHAIMKGYSKTGITIMHMNTKMDEGDIISQEEIEITDTDTASSLHDKLMVLGKELLLKTLPSIIDGTASRTKQDDSEATYGFAITKEDERINFSKTKKQIYNQIRGLNSWPGAYCYYEGKRLKVWNSYMTDNYYSNLFDGQITNIYPDGIGVKVSNGEIVLTEVQLEGHKKMSALEFLNGVDRINIIGKVLD